MAEIIATVRKEGDDALIKYAKKWDGVDLSRGSLLLPSRTPQPPPPVRAAVEYALKNVRSFSKLRKPRNWSRQNREGALVGEKIRFRWSVSRIYVPRRHRAARFDRHHDRHTGQGSRCARDRGGHGRRQSMRRSSTRCARPARPKSTRLAGAQAIAALAYGTVSIARVQKIFGPGNAYVVEAKRQVVGAVGIDQLPGPSEIAVVADESARADFIAADLLAQAEHGAGSQVAPGHLLPEAARRR